jgi:hypothetical protein
MTTKKHPDLDSESTFGGADAVPTDDAPSPPKGFALQKLARGTRACVAAVRAAPQAAEELRTSTTYSSTFGSNVPKAADLADAIQFASAWSAKRAQSEAWQTYVKQQEDLAWRYALGQLDVLRPSYVAATTANASVATEFAKTAQLFAPRSQAASKAVASKKAKAAAKAEAQANPPSPAPPAQPGTK